MDQKELNDLWKVGHSKKRDQVFGRQANSKNIGCIKLSTMMMTETN